LEITRLAIAAFFGDGANDIEQRKKGIIGWRLKLHEIKIFKV
jgi:hypothetical protein